MMALYTSIGQGAVNAIAIAAPIAVVIWILFKASIQTYFRAKRAHLQALLHSEAEEVKDDKQGE